MKKIESNNWKAQSKGYLLELEKFFDKADNIEDEDLKQEIVKQMLRVDNELTIYAEEMFKKIYKDSKRS